VSASSNAEAETQAVDARTNALAPWKFQCSQDTRLAQRLLSPKVQQCEPEVMQGIAATLTEAEVAKVFIDHVPGVQGFLYRAQPGVHAIKFVTKAYQSGLVAFKDTCLHEHLVCLLRLIVHHGHANGDSATSHLREVAEAFMDCQAVQARTIERVGLRLRGLSHDFRGLVVGLVGDYKTIAIKMLAADAIGKSGLREDGDPVHYENRLTQDLGHDLGLNFGDIRRARLDEHAATRFPRLRRQQRHAFTDRCRELFDVAALLQAFVAEVNSFSQASPPESLPRLFLDWASERLTEKHVVLDEATCTRVDVTLPLARAIIEDLFLGAPDSSSDQVHRGRKLSTLFLRP